MKFGPLVVAIFLTLASMGYKALSRINPAILAVIEPDLSADNCVEDEFNYTSLKECHCYLFQSSGRSNGTFKSPNFPHLYPINVGCILYIFVAALDELVEISVHDFDLRPRSKESPCDDYFRLFLNLDRPELSERDPWDFSFCGAMADLTQSVFYSRHRVIIAEFHTTGRLGRNYKFRGFKGVFNFQKRARFKIDGTRDPDKPCRYLFSAKEFSDGRFFSPDFPQNYPNHTECVYEFEAKENQRVIIDLTNIRLEQFRKSKKGEKKCDPVSAGDRIVVTDGPPSSDRVLGRFCGFVHSRQLVSHGARISVRIVSDGNGVQGQGFSGRYQFVNQHTVQPSRVLHDTMRGDGQVSQRAACALEYHSTDVRKSGLFELPQTPYEPKSVCLFTFHGKPGERITIDFRTVKLDDANPEWCRSHTGDRIEVYDGMSDAQKWLAVICGHVSHKYVVSSGRSLTIKFVADEVSGPQERGFEAHYSFVPKEDLTEQLTEDSRTKMSAKNLPAAFTIGLCRYQIISRLNSKKGVLQTPGYPNGFKKDIVCYWLFYGEPNERVRIKFLDFSLNKERDLGGLLAADYLPKDSCAGRDRLQLFKFHYQEAVGQVTRQDSPLEMCGAAHPQYFMSGRRSRLDVIFHSVGGSRGSARGVRFEYMFVKDFGVTAPQAQQKPGECEFHFSGLRSTNGSFNSPNYPGDYPEDLTCDYIFKGHAQQRVSISFADFDVASMDESPSCSSAPGDFVEALECPPMTSRASVGNFTGRRRFCRRPDKGQLYRIDWPAPCLLLRFQSNSMEARRGFFAYFSFSHETIPGSVAGINAAAPSLPRPLLPLLLVCGLFLLS